MYQRSFLFFCNFSSAATAFGLDYARTVGNKALDAMIVEPSLNFRNDAHYPADWEPGGEDFFSPALMEADLTGVRSIATALPRNDPARRILTNSAKLHGRDALAHVGSGDYVSEHWLASFAVYMLSTETP